MEPFTQLNLSDHRCLFRVGHDRSPKIYDNDECRGLPPRRPVTECCPQDLAAFLQRHGDRNNREPTPFTSLTYDLDRAFTFAHKLETEKETGIQIFVVDSCRLKPGTCYGYMDFIEVSRKYLSSSDIYRYKQYKTEFLHWGTIPYESISMTWKWDDIKSSSIFRDDLKLAHRPASLRSTQSFRQYLHTEIAENWKRRSKEDKEKSRRDVARIVANSWASSGITSPTVGRYVRKGITNNNNERW